MTKWSLSLLLISVGLLACSSVCEDAQDRINECLQGAVPSTAQGPDCNSTNECKAECAVDAPCDAFTDSASQAAKDYKTCVDGCG